MALRSRRCGRSTSGVVVADLRRLMPPSNACLPDWRGIADDGDAVHLSVAGYLTTATRMLPLADPASATVLAGCNPHQMWWLTHTSGSHKVTGSPAGSSGSSFSISSSRS